MEQNKTGKYIKYAIGEIVLVVIGILIALSINNWNEERKVQKSELILLKDLRAEFVFNKSNFDRLFENKRDITNKWGEFLKNISNNNQSILRRPGQGSIEFSISNNSLNSILNSGKIETFTNDSLKYLLSNWGEVIDKYKAIEKRHVNFVENELRNYENPRRIIETYGIRDSILKNPFYKTYNQDKVDSMSIALNSNLEYQNLLMTNYMWLTVVVQDGTNLKKRFNEIIKLLNQEIHLKDDNIVKN
ncbi:hypothetical protein JYT76_03745 [Olleya sp. AH-315-F22]|nr:hypothetical protein [Olleya sp. AH-315-F22]